MRPLTMAIAVAVALATVAARGAAVADAVVLGLPDRSNSAPWIAASGSFVAVAWGASADGNADVMIAVSRDGGGTFGPPVRVNRVAGEARINGEIAPRVALTSSGGSREPVISVLWNAKDGASQIKSARSADGGRTFEPAVSLQSPGAPGDRGWPALTLDARGRAHAIWLDHRGLAAAKAAGGGHKGEHDGVAMAERSGLYYASLAGTRPVERELFKGVCYCCKTAMATGSSGEIFAAWRHVFAGNFRDMAFTVSRDGGQSFSPLVRISEDGWSINGCPDDGPAMAVDAAGAVHLAWPTVLRGTEGAILYATSRDGRSFSKPTRVPTPGSPRPSHPQIAIDGAGRPVIAWDEVQNGERRAALRRATADESGALTFGPVQMLGEGAGSYPVLAAAPGRLIAAWTSGTSGRTMIAVRVVQ